MIKEIQDVFISNLEQLRWMDTQTKEAAKEKVLLINHVNKICRILFDLHIIDDNPSICIPQAKAIREQIGYSDKILNDEYLNSEYSDV